MTGPREDIDFTRSRAILLGTSVYDAGFGRQPMPAAANSLSSMRRVLEHCCGWPTERITELSNQSTEHLVIQRIAPFIHETSDVLIFYYVGHGQLLQGNDLGLALTDTKEDSRQRLSTSLRLKDLRQEIQENCDARVKMLILDCCFSGVASKYAQGLPGVAAKVEQASKLEGKGSYTWTACGHAQETFFEPGESGLTYFTRFLTTTISQGIPDGDELLTVRSIHDDVRRQFRELKLPDVPVKPEPTLAYSGTDDGFRFAPNAAQNWVHYREHNPARRSERPTLAKPRSALIVANGDFEDTRISPKPAARNDMARMAAILGDAAFGDFELVLLRDETADRLRKGMADFLASHAKDAFVLVYLSGVGIRGPRGDVHYAARDTDVSRLASTSVDGRFLEAIMDECEAGEQVLVVDTAHAAGFVPASGSQSPQARSVLVSTGDSTIAYVSSAQTEMDEQIYTSVFTSGLIEGMRDGHAARDGAGVVSVDDAFDYARDHVLAEAPGQTPRRWVFGGEGRMWLSRCPVRPDASNAAGEANVPQRHPSGRGLDPARCARIMVRDADGVENTVASGYLVKELAVLTVNHAVRGDREILVSFDLSKDGTWESGASIAWADSGSDLAILFLNKQPGGALREIAPPSFGRLEQSVMPCETLGFPHFKIHSEPGARTPRRYRDSHHAVGTVSAFSNLRQGTMSVHVSPPSPGDPNRSPWAGMAGAAVWSEGCLIGLITAHDPRDGLGALTASRAERWYDGLTAQQLDVLRELIAFPPSADNLIPLTTPAA